MKVTPKSKAKSNFWNLNKLLLLVSCVAFIIRMVQIDKVPPGISNDEAIYAVNAYSISQTGKDMYGNSFPVIFTVDNLTFMPVPTYALAIIYRFFGLNVITTKIINILLGVIVIFLLGKFVKLLTDNTNCAVASSIALTFMPWHILLSRTSYEGVTAYTLMFIGLYFLFKGFYEKRNLYLSVPFFITALYSYKGANIVLLPLIIVCGIYIYLNNSKYLKQILIIFSIGCLGIFSVWYLNTYVSQDAFMRQAVTLPLDMIHKRVIEELNQSNAPLMIRRTFSNIPTVVMSEKMNNYLHAFSPEFLFTYGENELRYSLANNGQLLFIYLPLLVIGIIWLIHKHIKKAVLLISLTGLSAFPIFVSGPVYSIRCFFMVFPLAIFIGIGIGLLIHYLSGKNIFYYALLVIFTGVFSYNFLSYMFNYHFRYVNYSADYWFWTQKLLAFQLPEKQSKYDKIILSNYDFLQFAYWTRLDPIKLHSAYKNKKDGVINIENISFVDGCVTEKQPISKIVKKKELIIIRDSCPSDIKPTSVMYLPHNIRYIWKIFDGDKLKSINQL